MVEWNYGNGIAEIGGNFFPPPILAMPLPQTIFFPPIFGNGIATIATIFFFFF